MVEPEPEDDDEDFEVESEEEEKGPPAGIKRILGIIMKKVADGRKPELAKVRNKIKLILIIASPSISIINLDNVYRL